MFVGSTTGGGRVMSKNTSELIRKSVETGLAVVAGILVCSAPLQARITKIVVDETVSPAFCKGTSCASFGDAGQYEQISGRAFGELDPGDPLNKLIQDIESVSSRGAMSHPSSN